MHLRQILPVFAGMIPAPVPLPLSVHHSPRIRGDDPDGPLEPALALIFSPYSRG